MCGASVNSGTMSGEPMAHAAVDRFSRWSNSTGLACHPVAAPPRPVRRALAVLTRIAEGVTVITVLVKQKPQEST